MVWPTFTSGAFGAATRSVAASGAVLSTDGVVRVDSTAATRTMTLPLAANAFSNGIGQIFTIKKMVAANVVTVAAAGAELIDGFNTADLTAQYESLAVQSNGVSWDVLFRSQ